MSASPAGVFLPLMMKQIGIDPTQSSIMMSTTVTDVVGLSAFLGFALLIQMYLEAISKKGFWFKIAAAARFKPEEYYSISRI